MTDVQDKYFKMGVDDWDFIGQCTVSLMTVVAVVKQTEGDKYPPSSLVLPFMNSYMRSLSEDAPIKQTWLVTANVHREFPVLSAPCVQSVHKNIREDMVLSVLPDPPHPGKTIPSVFFQWTSKVLTSTLIREK